MVAIDSWSRSRSGRLSSARSMLTSLASKSLSFCRMSTGLTFGLSLYQWLLPFLSIYPSAGFLPPWPPAEKTTAREEASVRIATRAALQKKSCTPELRKKWLSGGVSWCLNSGDTAAYTSDHDNWAGRSARLCALVGNDCRNLRTVASYALVRGKSLAAATRAALYPPSAQTNRCTRQHDHFRRVLSSIALFWTAVA
jgi:hypothetical protein